MKLNLLLFGLLIANLTSCASLQNGGRNAAVIAGQKDYACIRQTGGREIRSFLHHSQKYWDAVTAAVTERRKSNLISYIEWNDYLVQNREFAKYFNNAAILYLKGDISSDFIWSVAAVQQLLLLTRRCYPDLEGLLEHIRTFRDDCITPELLEEDQVRLSLYNAKLQWDELFTIMGSRNADNLSDGDNNDFIHLDEEFYNQFNNALRAYLDGGKASEGIGTTLGRLKKLIQRGNIILKGRYESSLR
ncbi:MAG: hypothetical protein P8013_13585 [Candidatus Sulfobium sp.]|jgi:hypothetical protein